jgi:hypothetical protein
MKGYTIFWTVVIFFSLISFTYMSIKMLYRGIPELLEMFRQLKEANLNRTNKKDDSIV